MENKDLISAKHTIDKEVEALRIMEDSLNQNLTRALDLMQKTEGRVIVTGMGKSGHVGSKIAATLASTGTPSFFVHPGEASHGDLGMITSDDVVLAISYSGETNELLTIVPTLKREGARLIAMTGNPNSSLAKYADVHLNCHVEREACPLNLAPTTSTTATLALGDALAVSCLSAKGFSKEDFARSHPGGALGRRLLLHVSDVMRSGDAVPFVTADTRVLDAVRVITKKHIGMTAIVDADQHVLGIFTEGDLRRLIEARGDIRPVIISEVMTRSPATIRPEELAAQAVRILNQRQCNQLLVVDGENRLVGALHMHDLVNAKVL